MRQIRDMHPFSVTVFFVCVTVLAMSVSHPAVTAASLVLSALLFTVLKGAKSIRTHIIILIFFIITIIALIFALVCYVNLVRYRKRVRAEKRAEERRQEEERMWRGE